VQSGNQSKTGGTQQVQVTHETKKSPARIIIKTGLILGAKPIQRVKIKQKNRQKTIKVNHLKQKFPRIIGKNK
jgi:hypothetical protein